MTTRILIGDVRAKLAELPDESVHCVVTSPPYFGLRDYGTASWEGGDPACDHVEKNARNDVSAEDLARRAAQSSAGTGDGSKVKPMQFKGACNKCGAIRADKQIGLEDTPAAFVAVMVEVFREVRRVLRNDGTLWLNLGDSYASAWACNRRSEIGSGSMEKGKRADRPNRLTGGLKEKDLIGIPWRVAFALQQPYTAPVCVKTEIDRAWLAALMDGEGCIGIRRFDSYREEKQQVYQDGFVVYTTVTNNDVPLLDRCIEITGYGRAALKQAAENTDSRGIVSRRDSFGWRLDGNKAVDVIKAAYPYLIAKRKQACIAYTLDQLNKTGHGSRAVPIEIQEKKRLLWDLIKRCNQREAVDLPGWIEEPKQTVEPGWYLRSEIIWHKPNPMPESVTDRPTKSHEQIFLLTKSARYHYDATAIAEAFADERMGNPGTYKWKQGEGGVAGGGANSLHKGDGTVAGWNTDGSKTTRNRRSVWTVATQPFSEAHFATFPPALIEPCILAGCPKGGTVLDPFGGAGTTGLVADRHGRDAILIELNPEYAAIAERRIAADAGMFAKVAAE